MAKHELYLGDEIKKAWHGQNPFVTASELTGIVYRALENRKTLKFTIADKSYFIKIHKTVSWSEVFKNFVQLRLPVVSAKNEWLAIAKLKELNIETLTIAAYGKKGSLPSSFESFLITKDLGDAKSLEEVCSHWKISPPKFRVKFDLIKKIAEISQQMHRNGLCHRDLYICHFLLHNDNNKLFIIDLHRALLKSNLPQRWKIKDIGSLYFSAMDIGLSKRDFWRFMKFYSGKSLRALLQDEKSFWRTVNKRALALKNK